MLFYCCTARWAIYVLFHAGLMAAPLAAKCAQRTPKRSRHSNAIWVHAFSYDLKKRSEAGILINSFIVIGLG
jgi:hypothetical protein